MLEVGGYPAPLLTPFSWLSHFQVGYKSVLSLTIANLEAVLCHVSHWSYLLASFLSQPTSDLLLTSKDDVGLVLMG